MYIRVAVADHVQNRELENDRRRDELFFSRPAGNPVLLTTYGPEC